MSALELQLYVFALMLLTGMALGLIFDIYRVLRGLIRLRGLVGDVGDLLVWLLVAPLILVGVLLASWGELRAYIFIGLALGAGLYFFLAGAFVRWTLRYLLALGGRALRWGIRLVKRLLSPPAARLHRAARRVGMGVKALATERCSRFGSRLRRTAGRVRGWVRRLVGFRPPFRR